MLSCAWWWSAVFCPILLFCRQCCQTLKYWSHNWSKIVQSSGIRVKVWVKERTRQIEAGSRISGAFQLALGLEVGHVTAGLASERFVSWDGCFRVRWEVRSSQAWENDGSIPLASVKPAWRLLLARFSTAIVSSVFSVTMRLRLQNLPQITALYVAAVEVISLPLISANFILWIFW